ncbi:MAG TPA: lipocalin family protein [Flavobacterium sp.]|jgi:hypothetical protein
MKKIRIALASIAAAGLMLSCDKDDDGNNIAATIEGKWTPTQTITVTDGDQNVTQYSGNQQGCDKDYWEFRNNNVYRDVVYVMNVEDECEEAEAASTWSKTDNTLTITDVNPDPAVTSPPDAGVYEITKLTNGELRLKSTATVGGVDFEVTKVFKRV